MKLWILIPGFLAISLTVVSCQTTQSSTDDIRATWLGAKHRLPRSLAKNGQKIHFGGGSFRADLPPKSIFKRTHEIKKGVKVPAILYLHECSGSYGTAELYRKEFVDRGFAFFAPDSFKRRGRTIRCYDDTLRKHDWRIEEANYALQQITKMPWIDQNLIFAMGFSEGADALAMWEVNGLAGVILQGTDCFRYENIVAAGNRTPVLALIGQIDTAYAGVCNVDGRIFPSKSIVITGAGHNVASYNVTNQAMTAFFRDCCRLVY